MADSDWSFVPNAVLENSPLFTPAAHDLLCLVARFTGGLGRPEWFMMTHSQIASQYNRGIASVENGFRELLRAGVIESEKVGNRKRYRLHLDSLQALQVRR
jgi:hypothetical protein